MLSIDLIIESEAWHEVSDLEQLVKRAARAAYEKSAAISQTKGPHEVAINLSNDAAIKTLNQRYRGKDKATNVLSFPHEDDFPGLVPGPTPLGDIILAYETIEREAAEQNKLLSHHIAHLVVHGVLHVLGYDHIQETEAAKMEDLECVVLATLQIPSPYRAS